jgi:hypothetical protein
MSDFNPLEFCGKDALRPYFSMPVPFHGGYFCTDGAAIVFYRGYLGPFYTGKFAPDAKKFYDAIDNCDDWHDMPPPVADLIHGRYQNVFGTLFDQKYLQLIRKIDGVRVALVADEKGREMLAFRSEKYSGLVMQCKL